MNLVTGYRGVAHITSGDTGAFNASMFGDGQYVLDSGTVFSATVVSNNQVRIGDGNILMNGRFINIPSGTTEDVTFENNTASTNRNDLIVCRYTKSSDTGIESAELVVIKGTATTGTASDPSYNEGSILNGDEVVDMPLYRIQFTGITMGTPKKLFAEIPDVYGYIEKIYDALSKNIATHHHNNLYYLQSAVDSRILSTMLPVGSMVLGGRPNYGSWSQVGTVSITNSDGTSSNLPCLKRIS